MRKTKNINRKTRRSRKNRTCKRNNKRKTRKIRYRNKKIENRVYLENLQKLEIARCMVREKLELAIIIEVRVEELENLGLEILENLEKTEKLRLKKLKELNKLRARIKSIERLEIKRIVKEFNELVNYSDIELTIESKKHIFSITSITKPISNKKNLRIEPIGSSLKEKCIVYCPELPFGILSLCSYLDIKTMSIIYFDTEININKRIASITKESSVIPREILLPHF